MKMFLTVFLLCVFSFSLWAQWSTDASIPTLISGFTGEQVMPKVAITTEGNTYICRFDNQNGAYQVFLQLLSPSGIPLWTLPTGVLVSAHPQMTWLTEYDLTVDQNSNALIVFQDIRNSGVNNVVAYKVDPQGNLLWAPDGIALSDDTDTLYSNMSPVVFNSADNSAYIAWQRLGNENTIMIQRLSQTGQKLWGDDGITLTSAAGKYTWPQIIQGDDDNILLKYYIDSGPYWAPTRHVYVAKFDPEGELLWNTLISDAGGISAWQQLIPFVSDGSGGAVLAWYDDRNSDQVNEVYVQRVDSEGAVSMPANGAMISTDTTNQQYYPKITIDPDGQHVFAFYKVTDAGQTTSGLARQLLDFSGIRQWGDTGEWIIELSQYTASTVNAYMTSYGAVCIYTQGIQPSSDSSLLLKAASFRATGASAWTEESITIASNPTNKYHFDFAQAESGWSVLTWEEGFSDMDIYAMRINPDGSLGQNYPAPQNVTIDMLSSTDFLLSWTAGSDEITALHYSIYMNDELAQQVSGDLFFYQITDLSPGSYSFYIIANYDDNIDSPPSETVTITVVSNADDLLPTPKTQISIYPNPIKTNALLHYQLDKAVPSLNVKLYNLRGQLLYDSKYSGTAQRGVIDLQNMLAKNYDNGLYLLRMEAGNRTFIQKLILIR